MINFNWYKFSELTVGQLYSILALRANVFIVEQNCVSLDPDGKDIEDYIVFGRVVTARSARTKGYGKQLMKELLTYCDANFPNTSIKCSAQLYLKKFYEGLGFKIYGEVYEEDGIPHIAMQRDLT